MCSSAAARLPPGGCVSPSPAPGGGRFLLSAAQCQPLGVVLTQGEEYVVKHDSAGVALRMTAADPGVYGDHPDYREEWRT